jgi:signal transduction histidine kinase
LGLSLVAAIAEMHRMTLTLEDAGPGLCAVLRLKVEGAPHD